MRGHRTTPARVISGLSAALPHDRGVFWCAMGVLTYLPGLPAGARVLLRVLAEVWAEGRARIAATLRELDELRCRRHEVAEAEGAGQLPPAQTVFEAACDVAPRTGESEKVPRRRASLGSSTAAAARLLLAFGDYDRSFRLSGAEAVRLAPLVEEWWRRGATDAEVRRAVTWGAPEWMPSAYAHVEARLRGGSRVRARRPA
ncbi:hypothetical protein GCM10010378_55030 [Streptomyces viridochromogenes]